MSNNAAMDFINELRTNVELYDNSLKIGSVDEMVEFARKAGYDVTVEDLTKAEMEARRLLSDESDKAADTVVLSSEELSDVAGGAFWVGEEASDGFKMGCLLTWHSSEYEESCSKEYYCYMNNYERAKCHGPHLHR